MATKKQPAREAANAGTGSSGGGALVDMRAQMRADVAALASRLGAPGGDVIRCTQDKFFELPDGTKTPGPLNLVIVDFVSSNNFYDGPYDPKNLTPPACFAIGLNPTELVPSDNSPVRQADACAVCPLNAFGSGDKGNGKACKNTRVLAVLPPGATKDTPLWVLKTSPTAIKGFDAYVKSVANAFEVPPVGVVTEVGFDPSQTYGTLRFGNAQPNVDIEVGYGRRREAMERLMTEPDVSGYEAPPPPKKAIAPVRRK
jgi:hypothetical protein